MNNLQKLRLKRSIDPQLTWKDWELYEDREESFASRIAADELNLALKKCYNLAFNKDQVRQIMYRVMEEHQQTGASDTAVREILEYLLEYLYDK